jgi:hypothetical protein
MRFFLRKRLRFSQLFHELNDSQAPHLAAANEFGIDPRFGHFQVWQALRFRWPKMLDIATTAPNGRSLLILSATRRFILRTYPVSPWQVHVVLIRGMRGDDLTDVFAELEKLDGKIC